MKIHNAVLKTVAFCAAILLNNGCAGTRTEREFGDSVRSVMNAQIYDKGAAISPSTEPVTGGHAGRLEGVIEAYGTDSADTGDVSKPVVLEIGSNR
jgi:hypothetical protein